MTKTFDVLRKEELRIMGYSDVVVPGEDVIDNAMMGKAVPSDDGSAVVLVEFTNGETEKFTADEWETLGYLLMPHEGTAPAEPVELAEPAGLLKREEPDEQTG